MDPTTVLLYLVAAFGACAGGLGTVVASGRRATRRRESAEDARRRAVKQARWETSTELVAGNERVQLVRVAELDGNRWVVQKHDSYVDVPVGDVVGLLEAQTDANLAARQANGETTW